MAGSLLDTLLQQYATEQGALATFQKQLAAYNAQYPSAAYNGNRQTLLNEIAGEQLLIAETQTKLDALRAANSAPNTNANGLGGTLSGSAVPLLVVGVVVVLGAVFLL